MEPEIEGYDSAAFASAFASEDFVSKGSVDAFVAVLCKRTAREEEREKQRRHNEELDDILLEEGIAATRISTTSSSSRGS